MAKYNIIYTSPDKDPYLWSGSALYKIEKSGQKSLRFSGKDFKEDDLPDALKAARAAAAELFPGDINLDMETVEIKVSD